MASSKAVAVKSPRKLIEVALPLDKINAAAAREKSIRHGHPSALHLWWARRPLAAARAVLFAQLVNDPGYERQLNRGVNKVEAAKERERLFKIIEDLVIWENTNDETVLNAARAEIWKSWRETCELNRNHPDAATLFDPEKLPAFHDPFAGGGTIPLEAQRLGLESYASDLNPVAVTINKAMIEIPPCFAGRAPTGPVPTGERDPSLSRSDWSGASGLAEDVRRYGTWMRTEAERRIGHLYPKIEVTPEMAVDRPDLKLLVGHSLTVIAWLWARTVKSPNPAYSHVDVPLVSTFVLSSKTGKEAYVSPTVEGDKYVFAVKSGKPPAGAESGTKVSRGAFRCVLSDAPILYEYINSEANSGRMGSRLLAVVAEGPRGRAFLAPDELQESIAESAVPDWRPETPCKGTFASNAQGRIYGFKVFGDYFSKRQLVALNTLSGLVEEAINKCNKDAISKGISTNLVSLDGGGDGALAYAQAVGTYLAFLVDQVANHGSTMCGWNHPNTQLRSVFSRQAITMTWDYAETNVFSGSSGSFDNLFERQVQGFAALGAGAAAGRAVQADAASQTISGDKVVSTDPPYYDNIAYADLSDYFYVWLRRSLKDTFPSLFQTIAVPKAEELVASQYLHGGKAQAEAFFLHGMTAAMHGISVQSHPAFPITIYYAFKESDTTGPENTSNSGWQTFLGAVIEAGLSITGTWPMRTEKQGRSVGIGANSLASSIILVCRKRDPEATTISRREFLRELHVVLPDALLDMTRGGENSPVQPVDLSQAIIGPGMGIFSKYKAVLEADGGPMSVRTALQLINRFLADDEFDPATQFCLQWFESNYWKPGVYGSADVAARAKGTDVSLLNRDGVLESGAGEVRLLRWTDLEDGWAPEQGNQTPAWQALQELIRRLNNQGEQAAGALLARMHSVGGPVRTLAYRMYTLCERKGLTEDARAYNELIGAWAAIELAAIEIGPIETQADLF
jgi:putative DNA methylase